jgi:Uncharacterised nucleotidyltransferase
MNDYQRQAAGMVRAAYLPGAPGAPEISTPDWPGVAQTAEREGIAPLVYGALKVLGRSAEPPPAEQARLRQAYLRADTGNWLAYEELGGLLPALAEAQAPVVLLKGCALAATLYPEPGLRPLGDLDLLIPRAGIERAEAALAGRGFHVSAELAQDFGARYLQEKIYLRHGGRPAQVDLHWHLTSMPYYRRRIPIDWFWERAMAQEVAGAPALVFTPAAQLLHLSLHFALHHWADRMLWSFDLALLLTRAAEALDWDEALGAARAFGLTQAVQTSLERVQTAWGAAPPAEAARLLAAARPGMAERLFLAVMSARRREARLLSDGLSLPGLGAKLGFWFGVLFPSRAYMRRRYRVANGALLPFYYVARLAKGFYRLARSVISIGLGALRAGAAP